MLWLICVKAIIALGFIIHEQGRAALAEHQHLLLNHPWVHPHTCSAWTKSKHVHMCMCAHMHKGWKFNGVKLLQMLILWVRKLGTLSLLSCHWETLMCFDDGRVLGDTNVFWRWLCFSYRWRLVAVRESVCLLLTGVAINSVLQAQGIPGRSNSLSLLLNIFSCFFTVLFIDLLP